MKDIIDKIQYRYIVSFAIGSGIGIGIFYYKSIYFFTEKLMSHGQLIQAELIIILSAVSLCIGKIIKSLNYYKKWEKNRNKNGISSKKYKGECCKRYNGPKNSDKKILAF